MPLLAGPPCLTLFAPAIISLLHQSPCSILKRAPPPVGAAMLLNPTNSSSLSASYSTLGSTPWDTCDDTHTHTHTCVHMCVLQHR